MFFWEQNTFSRFTIVQFQRNKRLEGNSCTTKLNALNDVITLANHQSTHTKTDFFYFYVNLIFSTQFQEAGTVTVSSLSCYDTGNEKTFKILSTCWRTDTMYTEPIQHCSSQNVFVRTCSRNRKKNQHTVLIKTNYIKQWQSGFPALQKKIFLVDHTTEQKIGLTAIISIKLNRMWQELVRQHYLICFKAQALITPVKSEAHTFYL